jgi:RNase H-like domain found in reverse transcriptase/Reverse transcriptase (RNA-dependent DNA polymerase)/Integrase zinc binding domain/Integrase core domain/Chromo (CHRromatin Organisation MOdifier) domain
MMASGLRVAEGELEHLEGKHLVVACTLSFAGKSIRTYALIDSGATGLAFIDQDFACFHEIPLTALSKSLALEVIDGRPIASGKITHLTVANMAIHDHSENLPMLVTRLGHYPLVLGIPWLERHDVGLRFSSRTVSFGSQYCLSHCSPGVVSVQAISSALPERPVPSIALVGASSYTRLARQAIRKGLQLFSLNLHEVNAALSDKEADMREEARRIVPPQYHEFLPMFLPQLHRALPPHRPYDHAIPLRENSTPPFGPLYSLSRNELEAAREWIQDNLRKGFIRASSSPAAAPILFVKKPDGSLRLCVDYRGLNEITIKDRYPLPLIQETLMRIEKAKYFTTLDLPSAYNLIRIREGDEWKAAFRTRYGLFEPLVMQFGLTNAPATFQHLINDTLRPFLDRFCTAYLDDIFIYSSTLEEHQEHVRLVLEALRVAGLGLNPTKCHFNSQRVKYLGFIVTPRGLEMDPTKVDAVRNWPEPRHVKDLQTFLGFANFYRRFIAGYSRVCQPLTELTRKDTPWDWPSNPRRQAAFRHLCTLFTSAPILRHFDFDRPVVVETDSSDYVSAGVLSQPDDTGVIHPVAFFSKKLTPAECNYEIYDKELLAIVRSFEEWRPYLESAPHRIQVLTDHRNLEYFMSTKLLNRRQARWSEFLSRFEFQITYRPGKAGAKPDALTRRSGDLPQEGDDRLAHQSQVLLKSHNIDPAIFSAAQVILRGAATSQPSSFHAPPPPCEDRPTPPPSLNTLFGDGYAADPFPDHVIDLLRKGATRSKRISLAQCSVGPNNRLYYDERLFVPKHDPLRLELIRRHHDIPTAGHPGRAKTLELLCRRYYWPGVRRAVDQYIRNCHTCQRIRTPRHAPYGILKPLPIPVRPWKSIAMDFVTGLPLVDGYDSIWVVVDRLTKQRHFVACSSAASAEDLADLFLAHVWKLHGLPDDIVSDRGPQFASKFWRRLCHHLRVSPKLSTAFHPQTDGQTERVNGIMEQYLRAYVTYQQDNWPTLLPLAEFAGNNHPSETTGLSPFFANYGFDPRLDFDLEGPANPNPGELKAQEVATYFATLHDWLRAELLRGQHRYQEGADNRRTPAPRFSVGDLVWLRAPNIRSERPSRKLDHRRLGPFPVKRVISSHAYELELPDTMRVHPVFAVSLLDPAAADPLPGQRNPPPPPVIVDNAEEYEIDEILDSKYARKTLKYLVKWVGYDSPTWEPAHMLNQAVAVDNFHAAYPAKPGPLSYLP